MARRCHAGPEAVLLHACLDLLKLRRVAAWRTNSGTVKVGRRLIQLAPAGTADILGVLRPHGRFLALEIKTPARKLTETQKAFLEGVRSAGGCAVVIRDVQVLDRLLLWLETDPWARVPLEGV